MTSCRSAAGPPPASVEPQATPGAPTSAELGQAIHEAFARSGAPGQPLQLAVVADSSDGSAAASAPTEPLRRLVLPDTSPMAPSRAAEGSAAAVAPRDPGTPLPGGSPPAVERAVRMRMGSLEAPSRDEGSEEVWREVLRHIPTLGDCLRTYAHHAGLNPDEPLVVAWNIRGTVGGGSASLHARHDPTLEASLDRCAEDVLRPVLSFPERPSAQLLLALVLVLD